PGHDPAPARDRERRRRAPARDAARGALHGQQGSAGALRALAARERRPAERPARVLPARHPPAPLRSLRPDAARGVREPRGSRGARGLVPLGADMRYAFLVAWREFAENVKTKGFWIGILIFPLLIY